MIYSSVQMPRPSLDPVEGSAYKGASPSRAVSPADLSFPSNPCGPLSVGGKGNGKTGVESVKQG